MLLEMFGTRRLRTLVAEHAVKESLEYSLLEELYTFTREGWEQEDGIALLTLRRSAAVSRWISVNTPATRPADRPLSD
jgi:hypothetical protein